MPINFINFQKETKIYEKQKFEKKEKLFAFHYIILSNENQNR